MKLNIITKPASIKIKGKFTINVVRHKLKIKNSIELIKVAIDSIKCPNCSTMNYIIHDLKNKKLLLDHLLCQKCNKNIFSRLLIAEAQKKLEIANKNKRWWV
jgi:transposase-like protein